MIWVLCWDVYFRIEVSQDGLEAILGHLLKTSEKRLEVLKKFFSPIKGQVYYDDFCLKDPLPFFVWIFDAFYRTIKYRSLSPGMHDLLDGIWE